MAVVPTCRVRDERENPSVRKRRGSGASQNGWRKILIFFRGHPHLRDASEFSTKTFAHAPSYRPANAATKTHVRLDTRLSLGIITRLVERAFSWALPKR